MRSHDIISLPAVWLALTGLAAAQEGQYWDTLPLPGPLVAPVVAFGTNLTLRTATDLHVYSGITRTWAQIPLTPSSLVHSEYNDHVIVRDGATIHAWSTRTGEVSTITVSPSATLTVGTTGRTWVAAVVDGNSVHAYASFKGTWATLTTATSNPPITLDKVTLLVQDGTTDYALSAYFGDFVPAPAGTKKVVAEVVALTVDGSDVVRGYSALSNTWSEHTLAGAGTASVSPGFTYALLQTPDVTLGYSADTRTFAEYARTDTFAGVTVAPEAACLLDGDQVVGFSPALCSFDGIAVSSTPTLIPAENRFGSFVLAVDGSEVHAFSGVKGTFAPPLDGPVTLSVSDTAAFAQGASSSHVYNALANLWSPSPVDTPSSTTLLYNGVVVSDGSETFGYSGREDRWIALGKAPGTVAFHGSLYTSTVGNTVDLFDSRLGRWTAIQAGAAPNPMSVWRLTGITHDGSEAHGFSLFQGIPSSVALQGTVQEYRANSEIAFVRTDTHVHVFTSLGSLSMVLRYPEHSRGQPRGTPLLLQQTGPAGSLVFGHVGFASDFRPLGNLGVLLFDLGAPHVRYLQSVIPANGRLDLAVPVPPDLSLNGVGVHIQHVLKPSGQPLRLTSSVSPVLL